MADPKVTVRLPEELLEWADDQPGSRTETIVEAVAAARRRSEAAVDGLTDELEAAWRSLAAAGADTGDQYVLRLDVAESKLAERFKVPKPAVRGSYIEPLRQAGVAYVGGFEEVYVRVPKLPEEREEAHA